jgi:hypothetical protein
MRTLTRCSVAVIALLAAGSATAQDKPGRYVMSPIDGGFARLDTETGLMSVCKGKVDNFKCELAPDSTVNAQKDAERNTAEAKELRAEIKRLEELLGLGDKPGGSKQAEEQRPGGPGSGFKLPSEAEVDQAFDYIEKLVRKFKGKLKQLEGESKGDPL